MKCSEMSDYFADYVLGELAPELEIQMNEHLAICEECRGELKKTESVVDGFRDSVKFEPSRDISGKIKKQIRIEMPERPRIFGMPRSLAFVLGAFLLGVVMTKSIDNIITKVRQPSGMEVRQETPGRVPFPDTVEFYSVPAKNLASI
jgi:anti-sigma factor RsiW